MIEFLLEFGCYNTSRVINRFSSENDDLHVLLNIVLVELLLEFHLSQGSNYLVVRVVTIIELSYPQWIMFTACERYTCTCTCTVSSAVHELNEMGHVFHACIPSVPFSVRH